MRQTNHVRVFGRVPFLHLGELRLRVGELAREIAGAIIGLNLLFEPVNFSLRVYQVRIIRRVAGFQACELRFQGLQSVLGIHDPKPGI